MIDTYHKYIFFFSTLNATPQFQHINCAALFHQKYVFFGGGAFSNLESISPMVALGYCHKYGGINGFIIINTPLQLQLEIVVGKILFASLGVELKDRKISFYCNASIRIPANKTIDIAASCAALIYQKTHCAKNKNTYNTYISDHSSASSSVCFDPQQNNYQQVFSKYGSVFLDSKNVEEVENKKSQLSIKAKIRLENFIYKFPQTLSALKPNTLHDLFKIICKDTIKDEEIARIREKIPSFSKETLKNIENPQDEIYLSKTSIPRKLNATDFHTTLFHKNYAKDSTIMSFPSFESAEDRDRNPDLRQPKSVNYRDQEKNKINKQFNDFLKLKQIALNYVDALVYVYADKEHAMCVFENKDSAKVFDSNHLTIDNLCEDLNIQTGENCCFFALFLSILIKTFQSPKTAVQIIIVLNNLYNAKIDTSTCVDEYVHLLFKYTNINYVLKIRSDLNTVIQDAKQLSFQNSEMFRNWKSFGDLLRIQFVATHKQLAQFDALNTTLTKSSPSYQNNKDTIANCLQKGFLICAVGHILSHHYIHQKLFKDKGTFTNFMQLITDMCILQDAIQKNDEKRFAYYKKIFESETTNYDELFKNILNHPIKHPFYSLGDCLLFACYDAFKKCHYPKLFKSSKSVFDQLVEIFAKNGVQGSFVYRNIDDDIYYLVDITDRKTNMTAVSSSLFQIYDIPERLLLHIFQLGFTAKESDRLLQYLFLNIWNEQAQSILYDCANKINKLKSNQNIKEKKSTTERLTNINETLKTQSQKFQSFSHSERLMLWHIFDYKIESFSLKNLTNPTFLLAQYLNQLIHSNTLKIEKTDLEKKFKAITQFLQSKINYSSLRDKNIKSLNYIHNQLNIHDPAFSYSYKDDKDNEYNVLCFSLMRYHKYYQRSNTLTLIPITEKQKSILQDLLTVVNMDFLLITNTSPISIYHHQAQAKKNTQIILQDQFRSHNITLNWNQEILFNLLIMIINAQYQDLTKSLNYFIQVINEIAANESQKILDTIIYSQNFIKLNSATKIQKGRDLKRVYDIILFALKKAEVI